MKRFVLISLLKYILNTYQRERLSVEYVNITEGQLGHCIINAKK